MNSGGRSRQIREDAELARRIAEDSDDEPVPRLAHEDESDEEEGAELCSDEETETHKEEEEEEEPKIGLSIEFPEGEDEEGISLSISLSGETEPSMPIWLKLWLSYDSVVRQ